MVEEEEEKQDKREEEDEATATTTTTTADNTTISEAETRWFEPSARGSASAGVLGAANRCRTREPV